MQTLIRPSAKIRQNYNEISELCKSTKSPVFLTKNGEGDLVVMDIETYDKRESSLELREKLVEIEEKRLAGRPDKNARDVLAELRARHNV
ncbi:MAG: type II toxin-antitoxin system Phd/YefM family antitoxin [Lachnospiraceae bacterium]|nr:type II toxin-antitoxin system Phd/YefM family antitoxin [Lachnospiraceae bacterium]